MLLYLARVKVVLAPLFPGLLEEGKAAVIC